jgi:hypothetical protein
MNKYNKYNKYKYNKYKIKFLLDTYTIKNQQEVKFLQDLILIILNDRYCNYINLFNPKCADISNNVNNKGTAKIIDEIIDNIRLIHTNNFKIIDNNPNAIFIINTELQSICIKIIKQCSNLIFDILYGLDFSVKKSFLQIGFSFFSSSTFDINHFCEKNKDDIIIIYKKLKEIYLYLFGKKTRILEILKDIFTNETMFANPTIFNEIIKNKTILSKPEIFINSKIYKSIYNIIKKYQTDKIVKYLLKQYCDFFKKNPKYIIDKLPLINSKNKECYLNINLLNNPFVPNTKLI